MIDSNVPDRVGFGNLMMTEVKEMFRNWHLYKQGQITWADFQKAAIPIAVKVNDLLYNGIGSHDTKLRNQCKSLHAHNKRLWMFIANEGIEPTNNRAERAIRKAVIYRKLSFGTQSENGSRFVERIFSIAATCRMQKRSVYDYLVEAISAKLLNREAPKILPTT